MFLGGFLPVLPAFPALFVLDFRWTRIASLAEATEDRECEPGLRACWSLAVLLVPIVDEGDEWVEGVVLVGIVLKTSIKYIYARPASSLVAVRNKEELSCALQEL
jgi:hypothetical protein